MRQNGYGKLVNYGSYGSVSGIPHCVAYAASKGGVRQITKSLAIEFAPLGISANGTARMVPDRDDRRGVPERRLGRTDAGQDPGGPVQRHLISRRTLRLFRAEASAQWQAATAAA